LVVTSTLNIECEKIVAILFSWGLVFELESLSGRAEEGFGFCDEEGFGVCEEEETGVFVGKKVLQTLKLVGKAFFAQSTKQSDLS
jgi:hypothetical protein